MKLQANGRTLEKAFLYGKPCTKIALNSRIRGTKKEEMVRVGDEQMQRDGCLGPGANTWVHTEVKMKRLLDETLREH